MNTTTMIGTKASTVPWCYVKVNLEEKCMSYKEANISEMIQSQSVIGAD